MTSRPLRTFLSGLLLIVVFVWAVGLMASSPELSAAEWVINYWPQLLTQVLLLFVSAGLMK